MAVSTPTVTPIGVNAYRLDWESDLPDPVTYTIYRDGVLIDTTQLTSKVVAVAPGEAPVFEILDDEVSTPLTGYPRYAVLAWYAVSGAESYLVQQYIAAVWTTVRTLSDDGQTPYFRWQSGTLADSTTHQFRVISIGANGNSGTAATFAVLVAGYPDPPDVAYSYNAGTGAVTISAA